MNKRTVVEILYVIAGLAILLLPVSLTIGGFKMILEGSWGWGSMLFLVGVAWSSAMVAKFIEEV